MGGVRSLILRCGLCGVLAVLLGLVVACDRASGGQAVARSDPALDRRVAELLPGIEELSRVSAERELEVRVASAATLEAYLIDRLDSEYPGDTLKNLKMAYAAFGLIPDTVDLRALLVDLLLEQTVGYYDPARDVLFIREEVSPEERDAVLAHELVHGLQDQKADLDVLLRQGGNDARTAAQAAVEGHATVVMLAHALSQATGAPATVERLPELSPDMAGLLFNTSSMPRFAQAPAIIRETLIFPYLGGARYVQRLWKSQAGQPLPFGEWLPESTEQLLHTERLLTERDRPSPLVISEPGGGWEVRYARDLGELEIRIYFEEHLGDKGAAAQAAAGWDGDAYMLISRGDQLALVWYTVWDSESDAAEFARAHREAFAARFGPLTSTGELIARERQARVSRLTISGMPAVLVVETPRGVDVDPVPEAAVEREHRP